MLHWYKLKSNRTVIKTMISKNEVNIWNKYLKFLSVLKYSHMFAIKMAQ